MSAPERLHGTGLIDQLFDNPHRFEFFQAVRLLERWLADPRQGVGGELLPRQLRFRNSLSLSFPASQIESLNTIRHELADPTATLDDPASVNRIEMTPAFMGLLGVSGALPAVYTELIAQRELYHKDFAARNFLDLFSHRAVSLFFSAWKKSRLHLQYETDRKQRFMPMVLSLAGVGQDTLQDRLEAKRGGVDDESLAFFAGTLQQRALSAKQLEQLLARYLRVPVRIEQFCGRWYTLPREARTSLGQGNGALGRNTLCGDRVWQRDMRAKVVLGPLNHALFRRFLPGAAGATALRELLGVLGGASLEYEINLTLRADAVQNVELDSTRSPLAGRLGWDTYVQTRASNEDRCDVRYDIGSTGAAA